MKFNSESVYTVIFVFLLSSAAALFGQAGLVQHLDANIAESITTNEGGAVTLWKDQSAAPNPASFSIDPQAAGSSIITMTATTGSDENGPVEYLFTELSGNPGGSNSGWQTNPNYRDGDLQPGTSYTYNVTTRDAYGNTGESSAAVSATTVAYVEPGLENELEYGAYYGYQGWHFAEGDGRIQANDWVHWFEGGIPDAEHIHGDMWPDLREYDPDNLYETLMVYPDGTTAKLYSCFDYSTIDLHIKWMSEYGIKGCAVQRFTSSIDKPNKLEQGDKKVRYVMTACEKYGVKFWIMHDSGQGDEGEYDRITNDWKHLVDDLDILQSPAYTWQDGKPVYGLWGMGVSSRSWTAQQAMDLVNFFHHGEEKYRTYICAGVPVVWRTDPPEGWSQVYDSLDMLSPWRTIFNDPDKYKSRMQDDLAYCTEHGIDYNPVVSPGASTLHLRDKEEMWNWKPRNGDHFLWKQAYEVCNMGSKFMSTTDTTTTDTTTTKMILLQKDMPGIYPIPARDQLNLSGAVYSADYRVLNVSGIMVSEGIFNDRKIQIGDLSPGIYFLLLNGNAFRFIKE